MVTLSAFHADALASALPRVFRNLRRAIITGLWVLGALSAFRECAHGDERDRFFESKIRPLFIDRCIECHSGQDPQGGVSFEYRTGWESAGVVEPGNPDASRLIEVVRSADPETRMPPPDHGKPLTQDQIKSLESWIQQGAFDPREPESPEGASVGPKKRNRIFQINDEDRSYWAFRPINLEVRPRDMTDEQVIATIDRMVASKWDAEGDGRNTPTADPRTLLRRATYDLWGLPPTPEAMKAFLKDHDDQAWSAWIDSLLASPHYGERWGRHWLDWVRYAETNGYERDGPKPHAWRYRDYVIESFANDKPYYQFVIEQIAGDAWAAEHGWSPTQNADRWKEAVIATGFYRLHQWDDEPDNSEQAELDDADDVLVTMGAAFLGLTVGCARCHDHKFDPISQRDYYALLSCIRDIDPYGLPKHGGGGRGTGRIQRFLVEDSVSAAWETERLQKIDALRKKLEATTDPAVRLGIEGEIKSIQDAVPPFDAALAALPRMEGPKPTFVLHRGDPQSPRESVGPDTPMIFSEQLDAPKLPTVKNASSPRMALARWVTDENHPLTARVMVNRIWQRHFGLGIVPTVDDFGRTGMPPNNPELLDFLAAEFIRSGWSVHHMHRVIMKTRAYRMSSQVTNALANQADPEVTRFWRQRTRRMDAEAIRDGILLVAGQLDSKRSGPSVYPTLSQEVRDAANPVSLSQWVDSPDDAQNCRSVFLAVKRSLKVPFLETLDFANSSSPVGIRPVTTTAPQALLLLNDPWLHRQAHNLSMRLMTDTDGSEEAKLDRLWMLAYQRPIRPDEKLFMASYLIEAMATQAASSEASDRRSESAWISVCRAVLNSNEFVYVD